MYSFEIQMHCILSDIHDIYFNLAAEEFLLKHKEDNFFILWPSQACVVVGKHQNTMAEINSAYLRHDKIPVARRLTGGGAVFHDPGNLNFTFIVNGEKGKLVDFSKFLTPVLEFLHSKNILARPGIKNEINVNGLKISGNAEHVYKNRVLHHGTLLFHTDLHALQKAILVAPGKYKDKAVQSNRAEVINISEFLDHNISLEVFKKDFYSFIKDYYGDAIDYQFTKKETGKIVELRDAKYRKWEWIFGYSPTFEIQKSIQIGKHNMELYLKIMKGEIVEVLLQSESLKDQAERVSKILLGKRFEYHDVVALLDEENLHPEGLKESLMSSFF